MATTTKSKLERAAELCAERAEFEQDVLDHYAAVPPDESPEAFVARNGNIASRTFDRDALNAGAKTLAILATFEDEARVFVGGLMKRYSDGN